MVRIALSLGTNLGDRAKNMDLMKSALESVLQSPVAYSDLMETEPVDVLDNQEWYLDCIVSANFDADVWGLLKKCQEVERLLGRERPYRKAPRTADIDILLFGNDAINDPELVVPHPAITRRRFCLEGLNQIEPNWVIPNVNRTIKELHDSMSASILAQKVRFLG